MAADNQTSLRFSLKESVWFQKGQEVSELLSIALDPDIVIQERDYEVVVKGELQLSGEYIPQEEEEASFSLRELSPVRTVDYVFVREDGVNELSHSFPLEISIPRSRVKQLDELLVTIETFDYEMPEQGCLQLLADISISGLVDQEREELSAEEDVQEEHVYETAEYIPEQDDYDVPAAKEEQEDEEEQEDLFEPFQLEVRRAPVVEEPKSKQEYIHPQVELIGRADAVYEEEEAAKEEKNTYSDRDENALYLTNLFGNGKEEKFSRVRIYFVQAGDTMEGIAERYDTTIQHISRLNQMDDFYVSEGQILRVPIPSSK